jgi:hypothetical protein
MARQVLENGAASSRKWRGMFMKMARQVLENGGQVLENGTASS